MTFPAQTNVRCIEPDGAAFIVCGLARVDSGRARSVREAREIAERIAGNVNYLNVCIAFDVPGVADLRAPKKK